ncbi:MAG: galactokinase, partial [Clostridia bacterium]|nr:galactokinase [Clostridia bacterium]
MKAKEWIDIIEKGTSSHFNRLYAGDPTAGERFVAAIRAFGEQYGEDRDIALFSVPGRSEIAGNHTDHNGGCVLAGAIDRDVIVVAAKNEDGHIRVQSEGYREILVSLSHCEDPRNFEAACSSALVAGMVGGFLAEGYAVGGFDAYTTTRVLKGSGLSSSAAFEVAIGTVLNYFYNDGRIPNAEVAKVAQYSENVYFGKPCGLMDQMACAVGGIIAIDFA